jgi:hypothetical protein
MRMIRHTLLIAIAGLMLASGPAAAEANKRSDPPRPTPTPSTGRSRDGGDEGSIGRVFKSIGKPHRDQGEGKDRDRGSSEGSSREKDDAPPPRERSREGGNEGGDARKQND